jgi:hypothetical protein
MRRVAGVFVLGCAFAVFVGNATIASPVAPYRTVAALDPLDADLYDPVDLFAVDDFTLKAAVDSLNAIEISNRGGSWETSQNVARGTPCRTAKKRAVCLARWKKLIATAPASTWWDESFFFPEVVLPGRFLVATKGDKVFYPATDVSFFGKIDSPIEAAWLVRSRVIRKTVPGFEGLTYRLLEPCPTVVLEARQLSVQPDGTIRELARRQGRPLPCPRL